MNLAPWSIKVKLVHYLKQMLQHLGDSTTPPLMDSMEEAWGSHRASAYSTLMNKGEKEVAELLPSPYSKAVSRHKDPCAPPYPFSVSQRFEAVAVRDKVLEIVQSHLHSQNRIITIQSEQLWKRYISTVSVQLSATGCEESQRVLALLPASYRGALLWLHLVESGSGQAALMGHKRSRDASTST